MRGCPSPQPVVRAPSTAPILRPMIGGTEVPNAHRISGHIDLVDPIRGCRGGHQGPIRDGPRPLRRSAPRSHRVARGAAGGGSLPLRQPADGVDRCRRRPHRRPRAGGWRADRIDHDHPRWPWHDLRGGRVSRQTSGSRGRRRLGPLHPDVWGTDRSPGTSQGGSTSVHPDRRPARLDDSDPHPRRRRNVDTRADRAPVHSRAIGCTTATRT